MLPVDPQWKKDHAASVRRLIHDGVDLVLRFPAEDLGKHLDIVLDTVLRCDVHLKRSIEQPLFHQDVSHANRS